MAKNFSNYNSEIEPHHIDAIQNGEAEFHDEEED